MPATLAYAFAERTVWHGNYPIVGTMRANVLRKLALVLCRRYDAAIYPILGRLEGDVQAEGEVAYGESLYAEPGFQFQHDGSLLRFKCQRALEYLSDTN